MYPLCFSVNASCFERLLRELFHLLFSNFDKADIWVTRITEAYGMPPDLFPNGNYASLWKMGLSELLVCMLSEGHPSGVAPGRLGCVHESCQENLINALGD